jgi:3'(2'), 5'-bisphosphate nucleotidase
MTDAELAAELAEAAGRVLVELYGSGLTGSELGAEADMRANRAILDRLNTERPDDGVLSEESNDTAERLGKSRVWIVDPLDGTREYREVRVDWAVHVALAVDGTATDGAVALPALDRVLRSDQPIALTPSHDIPRLVVSRTRPPAQALTVAEALGADLVEMGSAGAKAMAVVLGEAEIYLHAGGQYEWDNCAPVAVAQAHGLHCSRLDGSPMRYNNADPYLPDLLICRPEWAERVLAIVANG